MIAQAAFTHTPQQTDAFLALYEGEWSGLVRRCRRIVRNADEAEDVAQEALLIVARRLPHLGPDANLEAYLATVAKRLAIRRREQLRVTETLHEVDFDRLPGAAADPAGQALRDETVAEVHRAIGELPERQRRALVAFELQDRTYDEIGDELGLNANAVAQLIHRARRGMRVVLERETAMAV
ncbi:MAG: sigma-70 family RNA polymerase sigma factor [Solirubrobacteraceae bacterium]|nr:sigma-70 family RNA polymerase sigma factor [Solirubrobacteraceae bacterium]